VSLSVVDDGQTRLTQLSDARLVEMALSEERVLENLSMVATAKRQAAMVRGYRRRVGSFNDNIWARTCTTRRLERERRFSGRNGGNEGVGKMSNVCLIHKLVTLVCTIYEERIRNLFLVHTTVCFRP
jgi:hypothetical protein